MIEMVNSYNKAVTRLDKAMKTARKQHMELVEKFETAKRDMLATEWYPDWDFSARAKKETAKAAFLAEKSGIRGRVEKVWETFDSTVRRVREELAGELDKADIRRAAGIDAAAVTLLNSGTMRGKDFQQMATDFSENPAMLGLVRQAAQKAIEGLGEEQYQERHELLAVIENARTDAEKLVASFDNLNSIAKQFSGRRENGDWYSSDGYLSSNSLDCWEQATAGLVSTESKESEE